MLGNLASVATNQVLTWLRNRQNLHLSREEFRHSRISFSQHGEDLAVLRWLDGLFAGTQQNIYIDAGCYHPIMFSNTLLLHKRGWRGINIDMTPEKVAQFKRLRPSDINVCAALSDTEKQTTRFAYDCLGLTDRLSDEPDARSVLGEAAQSSTAVATRTLDAIIAESGIPTRKIGYLNIDCEGHDINVLKGFSLERYRPLVITIEAAEPHEQTEARRILEPFGYMQREMLHRTMLFTLPE